MPIARVPLVVVAIAAGCVIALVAGCQTPPQNAYAGTVPPPSTGMIGQPAPYASYVSTPQGAAYPAGAPLPGPANSWQSAAPPAPPPTFASTTPAAMPPAATAPAANNSSWSWAQTGNQPTAPSLQQYGNQLNNQFNQAQQGLSQQGQQLTNQWNNTANQMQQQLSQQPQQWANQAQQNLAAQQQQLGNQLQNSANQVQQQFNNSMQQATTQTQQAVQQAWPQQPTPQTANGNWWPFTSPNQVPPARATPAMPTKY